jgi:hypothetical protein
MDYGKMVMEHYKEYYIIIFFFSGKKGCVFFFTCRVSRSAFFIYTIVTFLFVANF